MCVLSLAFAVCFAWFGWEFMIKKGGMMIPAFKVIPYYAVYASLPICGVLLFVEMQRAEGKREARRYLLRGSATASPL